MPRNTPPPLLICSYTRVTFLPLFWPVQARRRCFPRRRQFNVATLDFPPFSRPVAAAAAIEEEGGLKKKLAGIPEKVWRLLLLLLLLCPPENFFFQAETRSKRREGKNPPEKGKKVQKLDSFPFSLRRRRRILFYFLFPPQKKRHKLQ